MKKNNSNIAQTIKNLPVITFCSDWFECPKCGYKQMIKTPGDMTHTYCPECHQSYMYRIK